MAKIYPVVLKRMEEQKIKEVLNKKKEEWRKETISQQCKIYLDLLKEIQSNFDQVVYTTIFKHLFKDFNYYYDEKENVHCFNKDMCDAFNLIKDNYNFDILGFIQIDTLSTKEKENLEIQYKIQQLYSLTKKTTELNKEKSNVIKELTDLYKNSTILSITDLNKEIIKQQQLLDTLSSELNLLKSEHTTVSLFNRLSNLNKETLE